MSQSKELYVPILLEILRLQLPRGKFLVGLYEPSAQWVSFVLTLASGLLRQGAVVGIATLTTPPSQLRQQLARTLANLSEIESAKRFAIIDW